LRHLHHPHIALNAQQGNGNLELLQQHASIAPPASSTPRLPVSLRVPAKTALPATFKVRPPWRRVSSAWQAHSRRRKAQWTASNAPLARQAHSPVPLWPTSA
jgi:hypothetical protein